MSTKTRPISWSASRLKTFKGCPKKFYHLYVAKDVKDEKSSHMDYGDYVHKALEARISSKRPLPDDLARLEKFCARFDTFPGHVMTERQWAVTDDLEPTEWFARDAACRAIADVCAVSSDLRKIAVVDWKTGKHNRDDQRQLELTCTLALAQHPDAEVCKGALIYTKEEDPDRQSLATQVSRDGMNVVWSQFKPDVCKLRKAYESGEWEMRPSGLCRFCPVTSCPHYPD